jgi:NADP-dependent 3-hydroxy acid dehydrogenase YdfG
MVSKGLAIVTGATRGIGFSVSKGLAEDGYRVVLLSRDEIALKKVRDVILASKQYHYKPIILQVDITSNRELDLKIKQIASQYGKIDILVNSAAMFIDGSLNGSIDDYRKIIETNVIAQFGIMKTVIEKMKKNGNGYVFNIASRAGKYGFAGGAIYGSTKFALVGLTESLYREYAPQGIRFTSLCPGWVNTEMAKESGTPFDDDEMVQPEDILNTIRYLLRLSSNVCIREIVIEMNKSII